MPDPVSWLLIRPGWKVYAADSREVGEVDDIAGDSGADIFDGLSVATSALGTPRYVPAEQVGTIEDGVVHLTITHEEAASLVDYVEPASSIEIEGDNRPGSRVAADVRQFTTNVVEPLEHPHTASIWSGSRRCSAAVAASVTLEVRRLGPAEAHGHLDGLADVLADCVAGGASVSYLAPFSHEDARTAFEGFVTDAAQGRRLVKILPATFPAVGISKLPASKSISTTMLARWK